MLNSILEILQNRDYNSNFADEKNETMSWNVLCTWVLPQNKDNICINIGS